MTQQKTVRELVDERLDRYDYYRELVNHPVMGMAANGFTQEEITAALQQIDTMQDFYEGMLEAQ